MEKKLYLMTVQHGESFYVIAENPDEAQKRLVKLLDIADWWFLDSRKVVNIKLLAESISWLSDNHPLFGNKLGDLIIVQDNDIPQK